MLTYFHELGIIKMVNIATIYNDMENAKFMLSYFLKELCIRRIKMKNRLLGVLMAFILIFAGVSFPAQVQAKDKGYLVLTLTEKGGPWIAHEDMAMKDSKGGAHVVAEDICKVLGLDYKETKDGFKLSSGDKSLSFTYGRTTCIYTNGNKSIEKYPPLPASYDSFYYALLYYLSVQVQYYTRTQAEENGICGYAGVICYSTVGNITRFPNLNNIYTLDKSLMFSPEAQNQEAAPLVLVQKKKNGAWTYYDNMSAISDSGEVMVNALGVAKELGLDYKYLYPYAPSTLEITSSSNALSLTRGLSEYTQDDYNSTSVTKVAPEAMYTKWPDGLDMVHYLAFNNFAHVEYYSEDKAAEYKNKGYNGIICYSLAGKITGVPNIKEIVKAKAYPKYTEFITIGTVDIPKLSSFASSALKDSNWGYDLWEYGYQPLEYALDEYSLYMRKNIVDMEIEDNAGDNAQIAVLDNSILAEINGDSTMSAMILSKEDGYYEIYLSTRLSKNPNEREPDYSNIGQNVLKLFCAVISSTPEELNYAIYNSWEEDETYGINKSTWVTVGDSLVQYRSGDHAGIYMIKAK